MKTTQSRSPSLISSKRKEMAGLLNFEKLVHLRDHGVLSFRFSPAKHSNSSNFKVDGADGSVARELHLGGRVVEARDTEGLHGLRGG
jgi:hypothetical protein